MGRKITLEDLKRESPFTIKEIVQKYGVEEYEVRNLLRYHFLKFKRDKIKREGGKGRPAYIYTYIGKNVNYMR